MEQYYRRRAGSSVNAIFARDARGAAPSSSGLGRGASGRQCMTLCAGLAMLLIPVAIMTRSHELGAQPKLALGGGGAAAVGQPRSAERRKRASQLRVDAEDEGEGDDDDNDDVLETEGAAPPDAKQHAGLRRRGAKRAVVAPAPVAAAAIEPASHAAAASAALDAAVAPSQPAVAAAKPSHHPVLYPARFAGDDAVPEGAECERKWGNSWLREFMGSRRDSCVPTYAGMSDAARGAFRHFHALTAPDSTVGPKQAVSRVSSWRVGTGANFHWMRNVAVDFGRMSVSGDQRQYSPGFITAACEPSQLSLSSDRDQPALGGWATTPNGEPLACEEWVHTPTMVIQHDDIGNTYHNLADFWRVWLGLAIAQQPTCVPDAELQEDTTRYTSAPWAEYSAAWVHEAEASIPGAQAKRACPAGTTEVNGVNPDAMQVMTLDGRIMCNTVMPDGSAGREEDCSGPYFAQYDTWFGSGITRGRNFAGRRVCFSSLAWAASTPDSHIWDRFSEAQPCTTCPQLRQYAAYVAERWGQAHVFPRAYRSEACRASKHAPATAAIPALGAHGPVAVPPPGVTVVDDGTCRPYMQIVYVQRKKKPFSSEPVQRRTVANDDEFVETLKNAARDLADVDVVVSDFTPTPYEQQMRVARASHIMIGMHGAGMVHGLDQADTDECGGRTSIIELFPQPNEEKGIRNMNVQVGRNYLTWHNDDSSREVGTGTVVDLDAIRQLVRRAVGLSLEGRKC